MYSARVNGEATTFGTSGLLYRSNKLMYDRATSSLWSSLLGEPVIGPLASSGIKLRFFPVLLTTWGEWLAEHPDTSVLSLEQELFSRTRYKPEADSDSIYFEYRNSPETMFPIWNRDARLKTKDEILALSADGAYKAYPVLVLQQERVVNDKVGNTEVVIVASAKSSATAVYLRRGQEFSLPAGKASDEGLPATLVDDQGNTWQVTEESLRNNADPPETLRRLPSHISFWFAWYAFHSDTQVYGLD